MISSFVKSLHKKSLVLYVLLLIIGFSSTVYAINSISEGYRINSSSRIINAHNICRVVRTTSGNDVFAPTRTAAEWNSFISNRPSNVSLSSCEVCSGWQNSGAAGGYLVPYSWWVIKAGSFSVYWNNPVSPLAKINSSNPNGVTSYTTGGYRYERGSLVWQNGNYASYMIRRCTI